MLKRFLLLGALLCALIGVVQAGLWAAALFWFGLAQFASTFHDLVANCDGLRSCLAGSIEALLYAGLTVTTGFKTQWKPFGARSMNNGVYHLYEPGHPDLRHKDFKAAGLTPLIDSITDGAKPFIHHLKPSHIGKEREATMIFHHKDGTKRQMLYHFNNETVTHQVLASWHSVKEDEDFVTHNIKREQVGINDGMGMAFHDMDGDDWRNVDQGRNDVALTVAMMLRVVSGVGRSAETPVLVRVEAFEEEEEEEDTDLVTGETVLAEDKLEVVPEEYVVINDAAEQEQAWLFPLQFVPDAHEIVAELGGAESVEELVADEEEASVMATATPMGDVRFLYVSRPGIPTSARKSVICCGSVTGSAY